MCKKKNLSLVKCKVRTANLSLGSLFGITRQSLVNGDAKTVTFGTDLSVRTSHSCQIFIICTTVMPITLLIGMTVVRISCVISTTKIYEITPFELKTDRKITSAL